MSVHQLKDGRWICRHYVDKKQKWKYFGRGEDAKKAAIDFNQSLGLGKRRRRATGPQFVDLVLDWLRAKKGIIADTSHAFSERKFKTKILPVLGNRPASTITAPVIDKWIAKRLDEVKRTTVHRDLSDIIAVLNFAVSRGRITHNPLAGYRKPSRDDEIINPPTVEEVNSILAHAPEHLKRVISIAFYTGLRPGVRELFRLRQSDADIAGGTITIRSSKKGGLRYRTIPLHRDFKALLLKWIEFDGLDSQKHLITYRGKPVKSVKTAWATAKRRAGIKRRLRPYDLRHYFATALLTDGTDLKTVSAAIGHKNAATTLKVYAHTKSGILEDAIDRLPALTHKTIRASKGDKVVKLKQDVKSR